MRIQRIYLENYRSHKSTEIELSKGINLILGKNGSGKSSILEAIAMIFFNITDRTGNKRGKQYIRHGCTFARVSIDFIANDDRRYRVSHISKKSPFWSLEDEVQIIASQESEVREKLKELCGLQTNYADAYEHIMIAKQNEFVNIFKEGKSDRTKIFNKIFNTDSYLKMSDTMMKALESKYRTRLQEVKFKENLLVSYVEDAEDLEKKLEEETEKLFLCKRDLEASRASKQKVLDSIRDYEKKLAEGAKLQQSQELLHQKIEQYKKLLKEELREGKQRKKAKKIVLTHQESYEKYQKISKNLESLRREKANLERQLDKNRKLEQEKERLHWQLAQDYKEIERIDFLLQELSKSLEEKKKTLEEKRQKSIEYKAKEEAYRTLWKKLEEGEKEEAIKEKEKYAQLQKNNSLERERLEKEARFRLLQEENISKKLEELQVLREKESLLKRDYFVFQEKKNSLEEAQIALEKRYCPLLQENCENIRGKSVAEYFSSKLQEVKQKMAEQEKELKIVQEKVQEEKIYQKKQTEYTLLEKDLQSLFSELKEGKLEVQRLENEKVRIQNDFQKDLLAHHFTTKAELERQWEAVKQSYASLGMEELQRRVEEEKITKVKQELAKKTLEEQIQKEQESSSQIEKEMILGLSEKFESLQAELERLEAQEKVFKEVVAEYLENQLFAQELEKSLEKIQKGISLIYKSRKERRQLASMESEVREQLSKLSLEDMLAEQKQLEAILLDLTRKLGEVEEKHKSIRERLEKAKKEKKEIEVLRKEMLSLETKVHKVQKIREELRKMGLEISKYMLETLSRKATLNFHNITGRGEMIEWSNEENDKYSVYLSGQEGRIAFEHLSGGEQVAVAIALRETMTETFSNARFLILDEPTNNLDKEKKKLLAEHMGDMLQHLEQSIIVTHDDTFREMAERIIEL